MKYIKITIVGTIFAIASIVPLILVLSIPGETAQTDSTYAPTSLTWFYRPPDDGNLEALATHFDRFILTHYDEDVRDTLRANGVQEPFLLYLHFESIQDPSLCRESYCSGNPWGNQVAYKAGDFETIRRDHPDWFLRDSEDNLIVLDESFVMMDPANLEWQRFFLERAIEMQTLYGWNGVFLDNVEASQDKIMRLGIAGLKDYPDDATYSTAVEDFLRYLYTDYFLPEGRPLYANVIETQDTHTWLRYLAYLDGAMEEAWGIGWPDNYLEPRDWLNQLQRAEQIQSLGKHVILVSQGEQFDLQRQQFAFASYQLINNGRASFRYSNYDDGYEQVWLYDTYEVNLGEPRGSRQCLLDVLCWRRFQKGWILVLPTTHEAIVNTY